ncbi:MAG: NAD(P)-dependent oxidoreductase [Crocinitomicaceae bacterium]
MEKIKIGILREGKTPPDKRVPFTPQQCSKVVNTFSGLEIVVQPSPIRAFSDEEYQEAGIQLQEDLSDCDILMGVKEVNVQDLIPNKKFLFFSHTIKKQKYNRHLLQAILNNKIQLIDYELLKNNDRKRITGFGRFAGIVGAYNAFYAYGLKTKRFELKRAKDCFDREEMESELAKVNFEANTKIVITGFGKVGYGAQEIMDLIPIMEVGPEEFLTQKFDEPVFTHLETSDYYCRKSDGSFDKSDFYKNPQEYISCLHRYIETADLYMACHFWNNLSPKLLTQEDLKKAKNLKVVADISCDINDPIASTLRSSTIADPLYGYNAENHVEADWQLDENIVVMAVDNLPCELPKESSEDFGNQLINNILPHLLTGDKDGIIYKGSETTIDGKLNEDYGFLQDYVDGLNN